MWQPTRRRSSISSSTSSGVSPNPTIMPDLVVVLLSAICRNTSRLVSYLAALRTRGLIRRTVSMLCEMISGCASMTCATSSFLPWKSGISTSTVVSGLSRLISRMVRTQCDAPKSGRSSRSTEVTTAWESFIKAMDSATCVGSSASSGKGFPLAVLQNLQHRVQIFPPIMKVAVPFPQHSPILGQRPLLQMVCRQCDSTMRLVSV